MIAATGVSRTVVREAVAALRAEGLVITRQGVGAFVAGQCRAGRSASTVDELHSLREVIDVMELRTGIEVEAAGLAAERATPARLRQIADAYRRDRARRSGAANRRSTRTSRSTAASPRRPAIRSSCASWNISAASSFRARPSACGPGNADDAPISIPSSSEHREIVRRDPRPCGGAGTRRHAPASAQQPQALSAAGRAASPTMQ